MSGQELEACRAETAVGRQGLPQPQLAHHDEAGAFGEGAVLVGVGGRTQPTTKVGTLPPPALTLMTELREARVTAPVSAPRT